MKLPLAILAALLSGAAAPATPTLRVMSFNVRTSAKHDGANDWVKRRDLLVSVIRQADPDVIGTQELRADQAAYIAAKLAGYRWFGRGRDGTDGDEHMGVFYDTARIRLIGQGDFWLSDTPLQPGSSSWGNKLPRMVTWGLFRRNADGRDFYVFDTQLPYRPEDSFARGKAMREITAYLGTLDPAAPVVLMGDFNADRSDPALRVLSRSLTDARSQAADVEGPLGTVHHFTGKARERIDWIMLRNADATRYVTVTTHDGDSYPSDHFPVYADLDIDRR